MAQLETVARRGQMREVSIWMLDDALRVDCIAAVGGTPSAGVRKAAREAARGRPTPPGPRRTIVACRLQGGGGRLAVAARVPAGTAGDALARLSEAGPVLVGAVERRMLLAAKERQGAVLAAAERRLTRFGLDLHDGPVQEVAALLSDLRLFQGQLAEALANDPLAEVLVGRMRDLEQRAVELEASTRELARSAGGLAVMEGPLEPVLRGEARALARATGITAAVQIAGPVDEATTSQRITLLRGVQEALRNAREHSGARKVSIGVAAPPGRLEATVTDDGRGFDVHRVRRRAKRNRRLGLGGIEQRAMLLGGSCEIESRPGGPTTVRIVLPRWKPGEGPAGIPDVARETT